MKKLILMLLVLVGGVMQANADGYKVYFKPNSNWVSSTEVETFKLHLWGDGDPKDVPFADYTTPNNSNIYVADFPSDYNATGFQIVRCSEGGSAWNYSPNITDIPESNVYYTMSGTTDDWNKYTFNCMTPTDKTFNISNDNCGGDILPNFMDANNTVGTALTSNGDFTYSKTVTGNIVRKGTYQFKLYDQSNTWYSDTSNNYAAWSVSGISTTDDGIYNIVYSFNYLTGVGSATATLTGTPTITSKYIIAGDQDLMGQNWDTSGDYNVLEVTDGTGTLTRNGLSLTGGTKYYYKAAQLLYNGNEKYKTIWYSGNNSEYYIGRTGVYNATFSCTISTLVSSIPTMNEVAGYYIYGGTSGSWSLGNRMTENNGVYSYTFNAANGYSFVITPNSNLSTDGKNTVSNWASVVRPNNSNAVVDVDWSNKNGSTETANVENDKWSINYNGYVTINYDPSDGGTWSVAPYFKKTIKGALSGEKFYATFSSPYAVAIPDGITPFYAASSEDNKVTMTLIENGIPANTGAFLEMTANNVEYTFTPATTIGTVTGNLLVAGTSAGVAASTDTETRYILANQTSGVGFYKLTKNITGDYTGKAYLQINSGQAPMLSFDFGEGTTGINEVRNQMEEAREGIFDLQGRRVENPTKGLYIVNGKKVFIK